VFFNLFTSWLIILPYGVLLYFIQLRETINHDDQMCNLSYYLATWHNNVVVYCLQIPVAMSNPWHTILHQKEKQKDLLATMLSLWHTILHQKEKQKQLFKLLTKSRSPKNLQISLHTISYYSLVIMWVPYNHSWMIIPEVDFFFYV
jgi:hypothetical protein